MTAWTAYVVVVPSSAVTTMLKVVVTGEGKPLAGASCRAWAPEAAESARVAPLSAMVATGMESTLEVTAAVKSTDWTSGVTTAWWYMYRC